MKKSAVEPDWAEIALVYARNEIGVGEICERFAVPRSTLYRRARDEGWPLRQQKRSDAAAALRRRDWRLDLLAERLTRIIETYMQILEDHVAGPVNPAAPEGERAARTMTALAKVVAALVDVDKQIQRRREAGGEAKETEAQLDTGDANAARIREDLAERLARLGEQGNTG